VIMTVEMELLGERNLSQCHFAYQNHTKAGLGLNPHLHSGRRVTASAMAQSYLNVTRSHPMQAPFCDS